MLEGPRGVLAAPVYPLMGLLYMSTSPKLWRVCALWLFKLLGLSVALAFGWWVVAYPLHLRVASWLLFGRHWFAKAVAGLLVCAEAALPVWVLFGWQVERLQRKLFEATLRLQLGGDDDDGGGERLAPLPPADVGALSAAHAAHEEEEAKAAAAAARRGLLLKALALLASLLMRLLFQPPKSGKEGGLMRAARVGLLAVAPAMLPLAVWRDAPSEAGALLRPYWRLKGAPAEAADVQDAVLLRRRPGLALEYRLFGAAAGLLGYVPVASAALALSNAVGAALWAASLERRQRQRQQQQGGSSKRGARAR